MAATTATIRVEGYQAAMHAIGQVDKRSKRAITKGLREAAQPIADETRGLLDKYQGLSLSTIRPRTGVNGVYVTQRQGKKTGKRRDFGSLQMTRGFIPAAYHGVGELNRRVVEQLDLLISSEGLG